MATPLQRHFNGIFNATQAERVSTVYKLAVARVIPCGYPDYSSYDATLGICLEHFDMDFRDTAEILAELGVTPENCE